MSLFRLTLHTRRDSSLAELLPDLSLTHCQDGSALIHWPARRLPALRERLAVVGPIAISKEAPAPIGDTRVLQLTVEPATVHIDEALDLWDQREGLELDLPCYGLDELGDFSGADSHWEGSLPSIEEAAATDEENLQAAG